MNYIQSTSNGILPERRIEEFKNPQHHPIGYPAGQKPVERLVDLMSGVGGLGTLTDGSGQSTIRLKEGLTVPVQPGNQPLCIFSSWVMKKKFGTAMTVTREAAFILSTRALYRLEVSKDSQVNIRWQYDDGQSSTTNGDLTAPTVFDEGRLIAFGLNDGREQGRTVVLKTATEAINNRIV
ncbi:hypothetical protein [Endozoicomonas numazuensis]|uniref:Uncharacterized protein n=1 Tax=Endozoicomonas numazuensis TaxID=1137799 RepID=A0A081N6K2_9GAMM|nr:hypothetical protein [Endozoicomonas numazuensis]KEQ14075.1 hypothetical protein GZ78_25950 [Endozoicomonas numazuensis]